MIHYPTSKVFVYKTDYLSVLYGSVEYFYETTMIHRVEETFEVKVNYEFVAFIDVFLYPSQSIEASTSWAEAVAVRAKLRLMDLCQYLVDGFCTSRSTTVAMPNRRFLPLSLGISTLRTGFER